MITLTEKLISECESLSNSYTRKTLKAFGVEYPPIQGWKRALIGKQITREAYAEALAGRSNKWRKSHPDSVAVDAADFRLF